jgi:hypothetical protein
MLTYDNTHQTQDSAGNQLGRPLPYPVRTHDGRTVDSTGAFLVGELERLDQKLHEPLVSVTWGRDIDLREDVTIADEVSSYTISTYGSAGNLGAGNTIGNGKAWVGKTTNQIGGVDLDIGKVPHPLTPWALELKYTIMELESAAKLGRPIDQQKFQALQLKHQMDIDEMVYIGDSSLSALGLINNDTSRGGTITAQPVAQSTITASTLWSQKTPDEILADFNTALTSVWAASAWAVLPSRALIPPAQFGLLSTQKVSQAGNVSTLKYIQENNVLTASGQGKLDIFPLKWCIGSAVGGTTGTIGTGDRMVIYTKDQDRVRYPMTMLQRTPVQYDSLYHKTTYFCRLGQVEFVYAVTIGYFDGI